jgi:hypothetical protein
VTTGGRIGEEQESKGEVGELWIRGPTVMKVMCTLSSLAFIPASCNNMTDDHDIHRDTSTTLLPQAKRSQQMDG